jgi:predicted nucleotidyltransferase
MSNLKSILSSFHLQDELNPKIWELPNERAMSDPKGQVEVMVPKVRERLLEIAYEFIEFLGVDVIISDVVMTGSLANYNWSKYSDVDLHLIADFEQFSERELPLYEELFKLKKTLFNDTHDIKIYGYDVELYVQDDVKSFSSGEYSVLFNEWKSKPSKEKIEIDTNLIKTKSEHWMKIIDDVIEDAQEQPLQSGLESMNKVKDKLKKYRVAGLEEGGEMSDENLVFKVLRRNGYIQKLFDFKNEYQDKKLSLKEKSI